MVLIECIIEGLNSEYETPLVVNFLPNWSITGPPI